MSALPDVQEGAELLDGQDLEKTRGQTAAIQEVIEQSKSPDKPKIIRESTMAATAQVMNGKGSIAVLKKSI